MTDTLSPGITDDRFNEIVDDLERIFRNVQDRDEFYGTEKGGLSKYYFTLGIRILNVYGLWEHPWEPEIDDEGVDTSPNHPDAISHRIIVAVWERGKGIEEKKRKEILKESLDPKGVWVLKLADLVPGNQRLLLHYFAGTCTPEPDSLPSECMELSIHDAKSLGNLLLEGVEAYAKGALVR